MELEEWSSDEPPPQLWSLISNPPKLTQAKLRPKKKMVYCIMILSMEEMRLVDGGTPRIKPSTKCFLEKYSSGGGDR